MEYAVNNHSTRVMRCSLCSVLCATTAHQRIFSHHWKNVWYISSWWLKIWVVASLRGDLELRNLETRQHHSMRHSISRAVMLEDASCLSSGSHPCMHVLRAWISPTDPAELAVWRACCWPVFGSLNVGVCAMKMPGNIWLLGVLQTCNNKKTISTHATACTSLRECLTTCLDSWHPAERRRDRMEVCTWIRINECMATCVSLVVSQQHRCCHMMWAS